MRNMKLKVYDILNRICQKFLKLLNYILPGDLKWSTTNKNPLKLNYLDEKYVWKWHAWMILIIYVNM